MQGESPTFRSLRAAEGDRGRQQDRALERDVHCVPIGQPALQRGQAACLAPHAVRDPAREPEQLGAHPRGVDRVVVARDRGVILAGPRRHPPDRRGRRCALTRVGWASASALGSRPLAIRGAAGRLLLLAQVGRDIPPDQLTLHSGLGDDVELPAALVRAQVRRAHRQVQPFAGVDRAKHLDPVGHVHQTHDREREVGSGHQLERQREGQDVRVGRRQRVGQPEAAHLVVRGQVVPVGRDPVQR